MASAAINRSVDVTLSYQEFRVTTLLLAGKKISEKDLLLAKELGVKMLESYLHSLKAQMEVTSGALEKATAAHERERKGCIEFRNGRLLHPPDKSGTIQLFEPHGKIAETRGMGYAGSRERVAWHEWAVQFGVTAADFED